MRLILCACVLALSACASESWRLTREPLPVARVVRIKNSEVPMYCALPSGKWSGCAMRYATFCIVYLTEHETGDTLEHERKHCAGYEHE